MEDVSTQVLKQYFKKYYFKHGDRIKEPSEIKSREFGYSPFGGQMIRHLSFEDIGSLRATLLKEVPAGVYCSNSLYNDPVAEMHKKGWIKAEPIFDIDAGALKLPCRKMHDVWTCKQCGLKEFGLRPNLCPSCKGNRILELSWACRECLDGAKGETFKLLDILEQDFGIADSQIKIYFSGNAGYHIHVSGSDLELLDQRGRSELADYATLNGIILEAFRTTKKLLPSDPGWRGRVARYIRDLPEGNPPFESEDYDGRMLELSRDLKKTEAEKFLAEVVSKLSAKIDPMVTTDIHRIFRMPESLNNKTGLVKRACEDLNSFDPSFEAIALPSDGENMKVKIDMCPKVELGGNLYGPFRSEVQLLPTYVAVYLIARGAASAAAQ